MWVVAMNAKLTEINCGGTAAAHNRKALATSRSFMMRDQARAFSRCGVSVMNCSAGLEVTRQPESRTQTPAGRVADAAKGDAAIGPENEACRYGRDAVLTGDDALRVHHRREYSLLPAQVLGDGAGISRLVGDGHGAATPCNGLDLVIHHRADTAPGGPEVQQQWGVRSLQGAGQVQGSRSIGKFAIKGWCVAIDQRAVLPDADQQHRQRDECHIPQDAANAFCESLAGGVDGALRAAAGGKW